jgi:hypothetical protein
MSEQSLELLESLALAQSPRREEPCEVLREIVALDVPILLQELREHNWSKGTGTASVITTLRTGHHQLAQLLAAGVEDAEASFITGRSVTGIASLRGDPAFKELLAYYATQQEKRDHNVYDRLVTAGLTSLEILQQRLEESPEKFTNNDLKGILEATMDRSAAPAKGGQRNGAPASGLNVSINFVPAKSTTIEGSVEATLVEDKRG